MEHVICDLCGADNPSAFLRRRDRYTGESFDYVRCDSCGLIYLNPRPGPDEMLRYYPNEYEAYQSLDSLRPITRLRKRHAMSIMRRYVERFRTGHRLLDVGCATGDFLVEMRSHGWHVAGVELSPESSAIAREMYGLDVTTAAIEACHFAGKFEVVTLWDVLEHMHSPKSVLEALSEHLADDGYLVFSIPNLRSFDRRLFGADWIGWDAPRHTYLFDSEVLKRLLGEAGFELVAQDCILGGPGAFRLSWRFWLSHRVHRCFSDNPFLRFLDRILPAGLWLYKSLSYVLGRGPIVTCVARRVAD